MSRRWLRVMSGMLLPFLLGTGAFLAIVGERVLNTANIAWLGVGDPVQAYLGWHFFRTTGWTFPIGLNPRYGLELAGSILYSDSNPLLAFLAKPFAGLLPDPFQYVGIWLYTCFLLQAWFAWKLVGLVSNDRAIRFFGAGLFVFAPPFMFRAGEHFTLVAQFMLLAALYLIFRPTQERRTLLWALLIGLAALVHPYLLAMVLALWVSDLGGLVLNRKEFSRRAVYEFLAICVVMGLVFWQVGYFSVGRGVSAGGYGFYRMNLLSMIDPSGWSYVLKDLPEAKGDYEGFNYLGLGVIVLALLAIPVLLQRRIDILSVYKRHQLLVFAFIGLTLFAVTNKVGIGSLNFSFSLPDLFIRAADIFRSSGRMFWPVFYSVVFAIIVVIVRGYSPQVCTVLLAGAFCIQAVDTSAGWVNIRHGKMITPSSKLATSLKDPFWAAAAKRYRKVRRIMPGNGLPHWSVFAKYAAFNGLATDSVYLARIGAEQLGKARAAARVALKSGHYAKDSLYIIGSASLAEAVRHMDSNRDLLARIDGFNVLAPGWKQCSACPHDIEGLTLDKVIPPLQVGKSVRFDVSHRGRMFLADGWSAPEPWGVWSNATVARLRLPISAASGTPRVLVIKANALVTPAHRTQRVIISVDGRAASKVTLTHYGDNQIRVPVPAAGQEGNDDRRQLSIEFRLPDAVRPSDIGLNGDTRRLALGLVSITLR